MFLGNFWQMLLFIVKYTHQRAKMNKKIVKLSLNPIFSWFLVRPEIQFRILDPSLLSLLCNVDNIKLLSLICKQLRQVISFWNLAACLCCKKPFWLLKTISCINMNYLKWDSPRENLLFEPYRGTSRGS